MDNKYKKLYDSNIRFIKQNWTAPQQEQNLILSKNVLVPIDTKRSRRNLNTLISTASAEFIHNFTLTQILSTDANFVIPDPDGVFIEKCSSSLQERGYKIMEVRAPDDILDLDLDQSDKFALFYRFETMDGIIIDIGRKHFNFKSPVDMLITHTYRTLIDTQDRGGSGAQKTARTTLLFITPQVLSRIGSIGYFMATCNRYKLGVVLFSPLAFIENTSPEEWEIIIGNCDTAIFPSNLSAKDKEFVSVKFPSPTTPKKSPFGLTPISASKTSTFSKDEISNCIENMRETECFIFLRGFVPILDTLITLPEL